MALVRERRPPNLSLQLPRFPSLPPLHPSTSNSEIFRLSDFEKLQVLGQGNGGTVYKVRHRRHHHSTPYVLKVLHSTTPFLTRREVEIHTSTNSPNIIKLYSTFSTPSGDPALLLEHMDVGSLDRVTSRVAEPVLAEICHQVLQGLAYLHSKHIVHRDIKPANLLINSNRQVKIADFGVSRSMKRSLIACKSYVGTCAYMSPERFDPESYGGEYDAYAGDVWSLGLSVMEMFTGRFPLVKEGERPDWAGLMWAICFGEIPAMPEEASEELRDFVECCLRKEAKERLSVGELMEHRFVKGRDLVEGEKGFRKLIWEMTN